MAYFFVFEGIDGCGKTTLLKRIHNYFFNSKKIHILSTREPTYGTYGMKIRKILKEDENPHDNKELLLELYTKDREEHLKDIILPFLNSEKGEDVHIVLSDRYYHSTYVFQQTQGIPFGKIYELQKAFLKPTATFILDVPAEIAYDRISKGRDGTEKFEKIEFMKELRKNYLKLPELLDEKIYIVDGSKSKEEVFEEVKNIIERILNS